MRDNHDVRANPPVSRRELTHLCLTTPTTRVQDGRMPEPGDVVISLSADEALILFDLLHRWEGEERISPPLHAGEQVALWNLSCLLERELLEPFDARYGELVAGARSRLTATE
ncbi:hypothetical protein [Nocardioides bigeumensis]|uniref:Uncharacterized protein n=1 Tax=Nocardioides bigeumensis TaxID=433657 RepID=A0ABN2XPA6_9ACTN